MAQAVKIKSVEHLTHDVLKIIAEKPDALTYQAGQAADVAINKPGWETELRAFTFTSLQEDDFIEFNIKTYPSHHGVTEQLLSMQAGEELIIGDVFGDIHYKGEGIFIAGGAGITPFLAILKQLNKENKIGNNKLIFANRTKADIIRESHLKTLLGDNLINVLSDEQAEGYEHGFITADIIKNQINDHEYFYLCGPPPMMSAVEQHLAGIGIPDDRIVKEGF
ncbi:MAG: flavodoxin reductase [Armatimonadetes bacterium]|nr:flavodoxin reductase [Armatimonadota bacterium]